MVLSVVYNSRNRKSEKGLPFELIFSTGQSIIINSAFAIQSWKIATEVKLVLLCFLFAVENDIQQVITHSFQSSKVI